MIQAPTELDQTVAQAFERAANEAQAELELEKAKLELEPAQGDILNDSGNGTVNEDSTAEVSTR